MFKNNYDENDDEFDDDKNYDDAMQDQETDSGESKIEYRRKLLEIPMNMLPCPNRLSYEASYSPPTQDEVKYYYKTSSSNGLVSLSWVTAAAVVIVTL